MFLALTSLGWLTGESARKGLLSALLGLMLATVGVDSVTGRPRFSFGVFDLLGDIPRGDRAGGRVCWGTS